MSHMFILRNGHKLIKNSDNNQKRDNYNIGRLKSVNTSTWPKQTAPENTAALPNTRIKSI